MEAAKRIKPSVDKPPVQWNPVLYVPELGVSFLSVMAPVRRDGKFAGVVLATVPVGELSRLIESGNPESTMFILNASDGVVAHPFLTHGGFKPTVAHFRAPADGAARPGAAGPVVAAGEQRRRPGRRSTAAPSGSAASASRVETYYVLLDQMERTSVPNPGPSASISPTPR